MSDLLQLWTSGELAKLALGCRDGDELAERVGLTSRYALRRALDKLREAGHIVPTIDVLRRGLTAASFDTSNEKSGFSKREVPKAGIDVLNLGTDDFSDDEPTAEHVIGKPPLPAMPSGHVVRGVSTLVDADGNTKQQWIKTNQTERQRMEALLAALPSIVEPFAGYADPVEAPQYADEDLLNVFTLGDPHLGSHVWGEETGGDDYDLKIGERELVEAVRHLVSVAPPAKQAIVLSLGDFYHFDNAQQTTTKGTRQDGDTRWTKVFKTGIRTARCVTDLALSKHEHVTDIFVPGNHDMQSSTAMAVAVEQFYEREPRVTVDTSPNPFRKVRFGDVLIMICHGDEAKAERLWGVMVADYARDWGESLYRYILTGHLHHRVVQEFPGGCEVERFPTLAARDRWHHGAGYRAQQTMAVDTYHRTQGRVNRSIVGVREVRRLLAAKGAA